jgi:hypothetical protein
MHQPGSTTSARQQALTFFRYPRRPTLKAGARATRLHRGLINASSTPEPPRVTKFTRRRASQIHYVVVCNRFSTISLATGMLVSPVYGSRRHSSVCAVYMHTIRTRRLSNVEKTMEKKTLPGYAVDGPCVTAGKSSIEAFPYKRLRCTTC